MNDTERDLRELFETKAREAGAAPRVTPEVLRRGRRRQADRPGLGRPALEIAVALEDLEVVMDRRRRSKADRLGDLANRRREAPGTQRCCDEIQDPDLAVRIVLGHRRLLVAA